MRQSSQLSHLNTWVEATCKTYWKGTFAFILNYDGRTMEPLGTVVSDGRRRVAQVGARSPGRQVHGGWKNEKVSRIDESIDPQTDKRLTASPPERTRAVWRGGKGRLKEHILHSFQKWGTKSYFLAFQRFLIMFGIFFFSFTNCTLFVVVNTE